ncbi:MAG: SpaH/EbpB family LPXTG-anchored major pilin [Oscillospiraceae bacterium]|nr:SpaH/EbpB family LPXTG-anchored major pilin [Oscillospiraceae bacterium]
MEKIKRFLAVFLCIPLLCSIIVNFMGFARAADDNVYVLHYQVDGDGYDGPEVQYFSPYRLSATLNKKAVQMKCCLFSLYNTVNDEVIPAYCADISILANANSAYRRINLEESTFSADAAEMLRAIVYEGFYLPHVEGESEESHNLRVEQELKRLGDAAGVKDLTIGEAISGTQAAIWQAVHGNGLVYTDFLHSMFMTDVSSSVKYYDICNEERYNGHVKYKGIQNDNAKIDAASDREVGGRIQTVYKYLMSLDPMEPIAGLVSATSFQEVTGPFATDNGDGTFDVKVTVTVYVRMNQGDSLTLSAYFDGANSSSVPLSNGTQTVTLQLKNVPEEYLEQELKLNISGMQSGYDVYLFDAQGGREASQAMVGMDTHRLPVSATISTSVTETHNDRILNIYKTTGGEDSQHIPLEGITFDVYFIATLQDYLSGAVKLPKAEIYPYPEISDFTLVTNADGRTSVNLTQAGLPDGVYLIVERSHPSIVAPVDPFYVIMPSTNAEGTDRVYELTIHPKNQVKGYVQIDKDVISLGNDSATVSAQEAHTWIISATIPEDIANGKSYTITDTIDPRLDYVGNVKAQVESLDGQTVCTTLVEGEDYTLTVDDSGTLTVSLTSIGMNRAGGCIGDEVFTDYRLRVYFDTQINSNATVGEAIPNHGQVHYTNPLNFDFSAKSDKPEVVTGGFRVKKVDEADPNKTLAGAEFEVYRKATAEEVAAGEGLCHIPGYTAPMIKMSFYDKEDMAGDLVTTATSDQNGDVVVFGLAYGTYYLLETAPPKDYTLPSQAAEITVSPESHNPECAVVVENVAGAILPSTGGPGTFGFMISGTAVLCLGLLLLLLRRKQTTT